MTEVKFRPKDTLKIVWESVHQTPMGEKHIESEFTFSYDEIITILKESKLFKEQTSEQEAIRFSRHVGLACQSLKKGLWNSGSPIDKDKVALNLLNHYNKLSPDEYIYITPKAKSSIQSLLGTNITEDKELYKKIKNMVLSIGYPVETT